MRFHYDDGGRSAAGYSGYSGDCVTRAIAIATGLHYGRVRVLVNTATRNHFGIGDRAARRYTRRYSADHGVQKPTTRAILRELGFFWHPVMGIGTGCTMHMRTDELPKGTIIVKLSRHIACVIDGVLHDTFDCTRGGTRCVYGYWSRAK